MLISAFPIASTPISVGPPKMIVDSQLIINWSLQREVEKLNFRFNWAIQNLIESSPLILNWGIQNGTNSSITFNWDILREAVLVRTCRIYIFPCENRVADCAFGGCKASITTRKISKVLLINWEIEPTTSVLTTLWNIGVISVSSSLTINWDVGVIFPALSAYILQGTQDQGFNNGRSFWMNTEGTGFYVGQGENSFNFSGVTVTIPYETLGSTPWTQTLSGDKDDTNSNISQIRFRNTFSGFIKPDGHRAYMFGRQDGDVNETAVVTLDLDPDPYRINNSSASSPKSATFVSRYTLAPQLGFEINVYSVNMRPDGKRIICQKDGNRFDYYQFDLGTAWDMSTLSYSGVTLAITTDGPQAIGFIPPDGENIYSFHAVNGIIRKHAIPIAWDLGSIPPDAPAYDTKNIKLDTGLTTETGLHITADRLFFFDDGGSGSPNKIIQYNA